METHVEMTESDNGCSANLRDSSRQREKRVGLCGGRYVTYSLAERMAARTEHHDSGCWHFTGAACNSAGHILVMVDSATRTRCYAHRVAWEIAHGPIPDGMVVCHSCDTPRCVNPSHLFLGTQADNIHDSIRKGRFNAFGRQKLNATQVREIRSRAARGERQSEIANMFGVARHTVSGIVHGHSWQHLD